MEHYGRSNSIGKGYRVRHAGDGNKVAVVTLYIEY